jgi:hypothetical protein
LIPGYLSQLIPGFLSHRGVEPLHWTKRKAAVAVRGAAFEVGHVLHTHVTGHVLHATGGGEM